MAAEGSTNTLATNQSIEVLDFGTSNPFASSSNHVGGTSVYYYQDSDTGWIATNINIVAGNWYGILGARHDAGSTTMYTSYVGSGSGSSPVGVTIDGQTTSLYRLMYQSPLSSGSSAGNNFLTNSYSIARINMQTAGSGCDSTATLNLTINYSTTGSSSVTACDSYTWDGVTYTSSGAYTLSLIHI